MDNLQYPGDDPKSKINGLESIEFRIAIKSDLEQLVRLLADDILGSSREQIDTGELTEYRLAFEEIDADPNNEIIVAEQDSTLVGCLQLSFIANLTHRGSLRGMIEGVRVAETHRSEGLGTTLLNWAIERCRERGCKCVQLTTDLRRDNVVNFYEKLGFRYTHAGMKL